MTENQDPIPGQWPDLSVPGRYCYYLRLARRHLVGREHLAADAVSNALERWSRLPAHLAGRARIEQVIRSEAHSIRRSEDRLHGREQRAADDRALQPRRQADPETLILLRRSLAETCRREAITITPTDIEVLELLFAGVTLSDTARILGLARHQVKACRARWKAIIILIGTDPARWTNH